MKINHVLLKSILLSLILHPVLALAAQIDARQGFISQEQPLSIKLQSPLRSDFEHIANYWLENYSRQTLNQTPEEVVAHSTQALLFPLMMKGARQQIEAPTKRLELLQELQFINTPEKRSILTGIDKTKTHAGKISLFNLIATEQTNWEIIKERQNFIRFLTNNPQVLNEIQEHLNVIKKNEFHSIRAILRAEERKAQKELARNETAQSFMGMFARIVWLPSAILAITLSTIVGPTELVFRIISTYIFSSFGVLLLGQLEPQILNSYDLNLFILSLPEKVLFKVDAINSLATFLFTVLHVTTIFSLPINLLYTYYYQHYFGVTLSDLFWLGIPFGGGPTFNITYDSLKALSRGYQIFIGGCFLSWIGWSLYTAHSLYLRLKQQDNDFVEAQATAQTLRHATSIHDILRSHEETKILYPAIPVNPTPAWYSVIDRAQTSTFNENRKPIAPFMDYGTIENFIEACEYPQNEIGQMTRFYGELDAYTSLAQLYLDQQSKTNSFDEKITVSFADFIDDSTESILHIHNFWHPMIPQERVRPSILELGGTHQARDLVITGPNAGGKSVNLKALFANLFLAQTCGLATAESLSFTPFTKLVGRFKGVDDTSSDKSKFMLEAIEMTGLMKQMMDLKPKEHAFVVTDELFTGTEVGPAISLSMELCMQIAKMKNVMYVLATHYKQLTDLSATTGGVFENYKVEVFKDKETQKLMYPYKLTKGIGNTNVAFDIFLEQLEKQGVDDPVLKEIIFKAKKRQESIEQSL